MHVMKNLHILAHNIRSAENVGSLFRTCDSLGASKLWIVGYTPGPDSSKVKKTALGAQDSVPWEKVVDIRELVDSLRSQGFRIVGLELDERAQSLEAYAAPEKVALVLGNEVEGIPPWVRDMCDDLVFIRQRGIKESLNVSVATAIAAYEILVR